MKTQQTIRLTNVTKSFGDTQILKGINLQVDAGQFLILVGPSGCGKSTLLNCLAGLDDPTSGEIYIGDRLVNHVSPADRDIAMVFQSYALYPNMNVRENIAFGLKIRKVPQAEQDATILRVAKMLQMDQLLDRMPGQLSGGQRQCVAVARAAAFAQHVVIMDEPTAALGVKEGNMVLELIRRVRDKGLPVILISHNMPHVFEIADRIHIARLGKRAAVVNPKKISMSDTVAVMTGAKSAAELPEDCLA
jgi:fructose transport system ATP-binding protein